MAKHKSKNPTDAFIRGIFDEVDKLNVEGSYLSDENSLSIVNDWIDTGCFALNAIISGSLYRGAPVGRITGLSGPSSTGKTLIINKMLANAQQKGYFSVVFDTEVAVDKQSALNVGLDPSRVRYYPVETVEDCRNQIALLLDKTIEARAANPTADIKLAISIDSLGNLTTSKEVRDVKEGKDAMDMGLKAKSLKSMMRTLTYKAAKARVPIFFSNHTYDNPTAMYPELVKKQTGGSGPIYLSSILIQLSTKQEKIDKQDADAKFSPMAHGVNAVTLGAMTVKNRFIPPFLKTELHNNFLTGLSKFAGLKDLAVAYKVIEQTGSTYLFEGEKIGYASRWENDYDFLENKVMPKLEAVLEKELRYNTTPELLAPEELAEELEESTAPVAE